MKVIDVMLLNVKFGRNLFDYIKLPENNGSLNDNLQLDEALKYMELMHGGGFIKFNNYIIPEPLDIERWGGMVYIPQPIKKGYIKLTVEEALKIYGKEELLAYPSKRSAKRVGQFIYDELKLPEIEQKLYNVLEHIKHNLELGLKIDDGTIFKEGSYQRLINFLDVEEIRPNYTLWKGLAIPKISDRNENVDVWFVPCNNKDRYIMVDDKLTIRSQLLYSNKDDAIKASNIIFKR